MSMIIKLSNINKLLSVLLLFLFTTMIGVSQETKSFETKYVMGGGEAVLLEDAQWFMGALEYDRALPIFIKLDTRYPGVSEYKFYTGLCYLAMHDQQDKAIQQLL